MNYEEFKEGLTRIAIKGKNVFNKFAEKLEEGDKLAQTDMNNIVDNQDGGEEGGE